MNFLKWELFSGSPGIDDVATENNNDVESTPYCIAENYQRFLVESSLEG